MLRYGKLQPCEVGFQSTLGGALLLFAAAVGPIAWGHGDRGEYIADLDARIEAQPDAVSLLLERAEAHRRLGHRQQALADLERVLLISPGHHRVQYLLGLTHLDGGAFNAAESALRRFLETHPDSPTCRTALAQALAGQGRHLEAAREYDLAIAVQPTPVPDHFLARAKAYRAAGGPHLARAVEGLDDGMRTIGPLITLQKLAIEMELARGNHAAALSRIDDVLARSERKETWLVSKAKVLAAAGHHRQAKDTFSLAREALGSLPHRIRSSPAMIALAETISSNLDKATSR